MVRQANSESKAVATGQACILKKAIQRKFRHQNHQTQEEQSQCINKQMVMISNIVTITMVKNDSSAFGAPVLLLPFPRMSLVSGSQL